jgi:hypothetical protein
MIALEPPGNAARDIVLYRRRIFSALGEASALAFPELVPLLWLFPRELPGGRRAGPFMRGCWRGIAAPFATTGPMASGGLLYLGLEGPLESVANALRQALPSAASLASPNDEVEEHPAAPLRPCLGFFLCPCPDPVPALAAALSLDPPQVDFLDCAVVDMGLRSGPDPFKALSWTILAREPRRTGPRKR